MQFQLYPAGVLHADQNVEAIRRRVAERKQLVDEKHDRVVPALVEVLHDHWFVSDYDNKHGEYDDSHWESSYRLIVAVFGPPKYVVVRVSGNVVFERTLYHGSFTILPVAFADFADDDLTMSVTVGDEVLLCPLTKLCFQGSQEARLVRTFDIRTLA